MLRNLARSVWLAGLVALAACSQGAAPPTVTVTVYPATITLAPGASQVFTAVVEGVASQAVSWSVLEPTGGSVTSAGLYTAPAAAGIYHVVAASAADVTRTGSATVSVGTTCALETPQPSALAPARVVELGTHAVGETLTFTVPPSTGSVTILQQGVEQLAARTVTWGGATLDNTVVPLTVSIGGVPYFDDTVTAPDDPATWGSPTGVGIGSIYSDIPSPWAGAMTVPNTTNALNYVAANGGVPAGVWSVVVNDYAAECAAIGKPDCVVGDGTTAYPVGRYDLKALLKPGPVGSSATLDVTFYLVTDQYTAATAAASAAVTRMRQTLATYLGRAGIAVGTVRFVDLPDAVKVRYRTVDVDDLSVCGDVPTLLRMSGSGVELPLFLANRLVSQAGGYTVVGQDGTIPGPASVGGTLASGAVVSIENLTYELPAGSCQGAISLDHCGADEVAYIVAHETGHYLGLYHVTEAVGTLFDPVVDTPTCACSLCAPVSQRPNCYAGSFTSSTYAVTVADCVKQVADPASPCGGGDNLMFWLIDPARSTGTLTAQQGSILRANPAVR